jgi:uncharacterized protein YgiM (DUF1202 family)
MLSDLSVASSNRPQRESRIVRSRARRVSPVCLARLTARAALIAALGSSACPGLAQAQQAGSMKADETLRIEPSLSSAVVATAKKNSRVEVLERKGFWVRINSGGVAGWVKMTGVAADAPAGQGPGSLSGLASGRSGSGNIVSASGTRGLSEAELKAARPDAEAVKQVRTLAVTSNDSAQFASEGRLQVRKLDYVKR